MKRKTVFRFLWSFNSVVITLFVLLGVGLLAAGLIREMFRKKEPAVITNVAADPEGKERWVLGSIQDIEGTAWILMPLISEKKEVSLADSGMRKGLHSYAEGYATPSRNALFVNEATREMHWLFPTNAQLLTRIETVARLPRFEKGRVADAILYHVVTSDSNGDGKLAGDDATDIAASKIDGTGYRTIVRSVDRIFGVKTASPDDFVLLYQSGGRGFVAAVRFADMAVVETREMPRSEKAP